jgi:hypothetical protein
MTEIEIYDRVKVVTPRFESQGVQPGMQGYVSDKYPDGNFEVEVSDPGTGETIALFAANPDDLERDE